MITAAKPVSIQRLVEELRQMPEAMFDQTEPLRRFLAQTPVDADFTRSLSQLEPPALHP